VRKIGMNSAEHGARLAAVGVLGPAVGFHTGHEVECSAAGGMGGVGIA
jgi:hypothetical protein